MPSRETRLPTDSWLLRPPAHQLCFVNRASGSSRAFDRFLARKSTTTRSDALRRPWRRSASVDKVPPVTYRSRRCASRLPHGEPRASCPLDKYGHDVRFRFFQTALRRAGSACKRSEIRRGVLGDVRMPLVMPGHQRSPRRKPGRPIASTAPGPRYWFAETAAAWESRHQGVADSLWHA